MKKSAKRGYLLLVVVMYVFVIAITFVFIFMYRREECVKTQGIPVQCEILSVTQKWESDDDLTEGGRYQDITYVKYKVGGTEYTGTIRANLGEPGDETELVYLPSNPGKVYSLSVIASGQEIMKYIAVGWCVYWLLLLILLAYIIFKGKKTFKMKN